MSHCNRDLVSASMTSVDSRIWSSNVRGYEFIESRIIARPDELFVFVKRHIFSFLGANTRFRG
jgi:hypothetical protein